MIKEPVAYRSVAAAIHLKNTLLAGFPLLRDLGTEGAGFSDLALKRAVEEGMIPGPRLLVATKAIVATASYGPGPHGFAENVILPKGAQEASGIPEILKAVREQAGAGADWIKVYADGKTVNPGEILEPGTTRHFAAQDSIILSTGNAGGLLLKINDIPAKELGQKGEVRQFRITPSNLKDFIG